MKLLVLNFFFFHLGRSEVVIFSRMAFFFFLRWWFCLCNVFFTVPAEDFFLYLVRSAEELNLELFMFLSISS